MEIYGIKHTLQGNRTIYQLNDFKIILNYMDNIGDFLILTGKKPTEEFVTENLGINNPEYIRVSFDEIKEESQ
jgi:adenylate cyclase class IV